MDSLIQNLPQLAPYQPTFLWLIILCLIVLIQGFLAGVLGLARSNEVPGLPLKGNHENSSFRILRTYANSTENLPAFATTVLLAILAGVSAPLVNWLVGLHVIFRILYWAIYYGGTGKVKAGPRTITYVAGFTMNVILAVLTIYALLT